MVDNNTAMGATGALSRIALAGMRTNNPPASRPAQ